MTTKPDPRCSPDGPVYFARRARDDGHIHYGGGGGESHRSFYSTTDVRALFRARRAAFPTAELCEEASAAALAANISLPLASGTELHRRLAILLHDSIPSAHRIGVISESTTTHALEASESAVDTGRLSHAIAGQPISTVILAGELARKVQRRGIRSWLIR